MNALAPIHDGSTDSRRKQQARARRLAKRAESLANEGRFDEAIACQTQLVDLRPDDGAAALRLGLLYREARHIEAAVVEFRRAAHLCPSLCDPREALIETLLDAAMYDEAIAEGRALLKVAPRNVFARDVLSVAYLQLGQLDKALHMTTEMIRFDPLNPGHHFKRALLLQQEGNLSEAMTEYTRTRDLAAPESDLHTEARDALEALDDYQIHQILLLAAEDWHFSHQLRTDTAGAVHSRGFTLSDDGLSRTHYLAQDDNPEPTVGHTMRTAWGGVKFYH